MILLFDLLSINGIHQPQPREMIIVFLMNELNQSIFLSDFRMSFLFFSQEGFKSVFNWVLVPTIFQ